MVLTLMTCPEKLALPNAAVIGTDSTAPTSTAVPTIRVKPLVGQGLAGDWIGGRQNRSNALVNDQAASQGQLGRGGTTVVLERAEYELAAFPWCRPDCRWCR